MRDHTKLRAFELADEVAVLIYRATRGFSKEEIYGLTSQMRRAAVSVPSNIVEGCVRESQAEYLRFLDSLNNLSSNKKQVFLRTCFFVVGFVLFCLFFIALL